MIKQPIPKVSEEWTILKLLQWATSFFTTHRIDSPRSTAEILLAHSLKVERIDLYLRYDQPLTTYELSDFKNLIKRRLNREPVAYIIGFKEFWSLRFAVSRDVLIPRPDTECLVEAALGIFSINQKKEKNIDLQPSDSSKGCRILELGTGSGAIIISLASSLSKSRAKHCYFASDINLKALKIAMENAGYHCLDETIHFFSGDWMSPVNKNKDPFDIIVSNPPYIPKKVIKTLQPEIYQYEPRLALDGGEDGLSAIRNIILSVPQFLKRKGCLLLEIGYDQKQKVRQIADESGFYEPAFFIKDLAGHTRVVQLVKK